MARSSRSGLATDTAGNAVLDPTKNVERLIEAGLQRQDDLREAESRHVREVLKIHSRYGEKLRKAETGRINAIRQIDVQAVQNAAEVQATQATALAGQVAASAEAMRVQVQAAATAAADALSKSLEPIQKDIQDLRKAQYEAQGKTGANVETSGSRRDTMMAVIAAVAVGVALLSIIASVVISVVSSGGHP